MESPRKLHKRVFTVILAFACICIMAVPTFALEYVGDDSASTYPVIPLEVLIRPDPELDEHFYFGAPWNSSYSSTEHNSSLITITNSYGTVGQLFCNEPMPSPGSNIEEYQFGYASNYNAIRVDRYELFFYSPDFIYYESTTDHPALSVHGYEGLASINVELSFIINVPITYDDPYGAPIFEFIQIPVQIRDRSMWEVELMVDIADYLGDYAGTDHSYIISDYRCLITVDRGGDELDGATSFCLKMPVDHRVQDVQDYLATITWIGDADVILPPPEAGDLNNVGNGLVSSIGAVVDFEIVPGFSFGNFLLYGFLLALLVLFFKFMGG